MSTLGIVLALLGVVVAGVGYQRFRGPWARLRDLKAQDANVARYEAWRGGLRSEGKTGASVAMEMFRRQARDAAILMAAGVALVVAGLLIPA